MLITVCRLSRSSLLNRSAVSSSWTRTLPRSQMARLCHEMTSSPDRFGREQSQYVAMRSRLFLALLHGRHMS